MTQFALGYANALTSAQDNACVSRRGAVAEWLRRGLQILVPRFDSGRRLQHFREHMQTAVHPQPTIVRRIGIWIALAVGLAACAHERGAGSLHVVFLGDTSFGENYQDALLNQGKPAPVYSHGFSAILEPFAKLLASADVVIANLETPLSEDRDSPFEGRKGYIHYSDPATTTAALSKVGVTNVSLANNHTLDLGPDGLDDTLAALSASQLDACGAGPANQASVPVLVPGGSSSANLAIFCVFEHRKRYAREYDWYANDHPGVFALIPRTLAAKISAIKHASPETMVIVFVHWGRNYRWVNDEQREAARTLTEAGADLIIGHGAHQLQEIERIRDGLAVYGLGNFVFGSPGRTARFSAPPYSLVALLEIGSLTNAKGSATLRFFPIVTDNQVTNYRPRFVNREEFDDVLSLLIERTPELQFDMIASPNADPPSFEIPLN